MYSITVSRITSGELLKQRNGFLIRRSYEAAIANSTEFALTPPFGELVQVGLKPGLAQRTQYDLRELLCRGALMVHYATKL